MRKTLLIIGFGFLGGALREWLTLLSGQQHFLMVVAINLGGSFLLAFCASALPLLFNISTDLLAGITVGFVGTFTTFSTFAVDVIKLCNYSLIAGIGYLLASVIFGYIFAQLEIGLANLLVAKWGALK